MGQHPPPHVAPSPHGACWFGFGMLLGKTQKKHPGDLPPTMQK